jgi:DNA repair protein RecO (recombination protein O)
METHEQAAFLLHSRPYKEHQQLLEFLTENDGKVAAVTYVGKTNKSNKKALLQPFTPLKVILTGRNNLKYLKQVEPDGKSLRLVGNHLFSGFYLNELIVRLLGEHISCESLFFQYRMSLEALINKDPIEKTLRAFEFSLLEELGLSLDFSPVFQSQCPSFYYLDEEGFIPALTKLSLTRYDAIHLQAIARHDLSSPEVQYSFKLLMRQIINQLLGNKPLNSRKLFMPKTRS